MKKKIKNEFLRSLNIMDVENVPREINDEILNRWLSIGFISNLNDDLSKKCAMSFEKMAIYLISLEPEFTRKKANFNFIVDCSFACVRAVVQFLNDATNPEAIVEGIIVLEELFNFKKATKNGLNANAEFCKIIISKVLCDKLNNGRYKVVKILENFK